MDFKTFSGKNMETVTADAVSALGVASADELIIEVLDKGKEGLFGIGSRPAVIQAKKKFTLEGAAEEFLKDVFHTMNMEVVLDIVMNEEEKTMDIDLKGDDMGILIGKRGQTLDSLQYLTSLVVNKYTEDYVRVKLDIENYRERRKETLETLAKNIAYKVKRTRHQVALEPMNPYERRIIHSALQNDKYVATKSEGEEPYRHVVVYLKKETKEYSGRNYGKRDNGGRRDYNRGGYRKDYNRDNRGYNRDYKKSYDSESAAPETATEE